MVWNGKAAEVPRNGINQMNNSRVTRSGIHHHPASQNNSLSRYWVKVLGANVDEVMRCLQNDMR